MTIDIANDDERVLSSDVEAASEATETTALLKNPEDQPWKPGKGFIWIEIGASVCSLDPRI